MKAPCTTHRIITVIIFFFLVFSSWPVNEEIKRKENPLGVPFLSVHVLSLQ